MASKSILKQKHINFQDYVELITGRKVISLDSKGKQLNNPYIGTKIFNSKKLQHDIEAITNQDNTEEIISGMRGLSKVEFQVQAFGGDADYVLTRLASSFLSSVFLDKLAIHGFGFSECSEVIDISAALIDSKWESRSQMSCYFYMSLAEEFVIDHFNHINLTTNISDKDYSKTERIPEA